ILLSFLGLGFLLGFTPCVLPMIPILSSIIVGHRFKHIPFKTFLLSLSYVMGMAISYAIAGMVIALIGSRIQTTLQQPWIIVIASLLFVWLAFSLFGFYQLRLPARLQKRITDMSNRQKGGSYLGVFFMGGISSLIVSPCVSAPLVGVLAYIADSGDVILGAIALFLLGFGMGIPLLLFGASAGKLLPKAGSWMIIIERAVGVVLLALAIGLLGRVLPSPVILVLWGVLLIFIAIYISLFKRTATDRGFIRRGIASVILVYGIILVIGGFLGNKDPLHPWDSGKMISVQRTLHFQTITDMDNLNMALANAKQDGKPVLLDFYADWCVACVIMEQHVFTDNNVMEALSPFVLLRIDVTKNSDFNQAVMSRYGVIAPPTFLFFESSGVEYRSARIIGEKSSDQFLTQLKKINEREINAN
ncbi:MAG TPA: protein-disulfide reductase DsbD, partial [Gammaproteobacteria bacterium]|nr:protein-disulfide reductase DsbD [Gammaproteobacteria bacterium]